MIHMLNENELIPSPPNRNQPNHVVPLFQKRLAMQMYDGYAIYSQCPVNLLLRPWTCNGFARDHRTCRRASNLFW
jgi:hypothetical protein